jgi:hypothetical protein
VLTVLLLPVGGAARAAECLPQFIPAYDAQTPAGPAWVHAPLSKLKRDTQYTVIRQDGQILLKAQADRAASAYVHLEKVDPAEHPILRWRWRTPALIEAADNRDPKREDSPVRLIVGFDGDKSKLPDKEQRRLALGKTMSGREAPFATLMYIWENRAEVGTVIPSAHSEQIKMIVAESGAQNVGAWRSYERNLVEDYRRAFGTAPGAVLGVAVMTDTDNTGAKAEGFYGPISFSCNAAAGK